MPTDQERMQAYNDCWAEYQKQINQDGIGFIFDVASGNIIGAGANWGDMVLKQHPNCMALLTPEQQQKVRDEAHDEIMQRMHDREPR